MCMKGSMVRWGGRCNTLHVLVIIEQHLWYLRFQWLTGRLTAKSDVYSFGVMLLELLCGRPALDKTKVGIEQKLVDWAKPYLGDKRKLFRIMDPKLEGQYPQKGANSVANLALQCLNSEPKIRPRMSEVLKSLEGLQDTKDAARCSNTEQPANTNHIQRSPIRHMRSPLNLTPSGSPMPLPSTRQSPRLRWEIVRSSQSGI